MSTSKQTENIKHTPKVEDQPKNTRINATYFLSYFPN